MVGKNEKVETSNTLEIGSNDLISCFHLLLIPLKILRKLFDSIAMIMLF